MKINTENFEGYVESHFNKRWTDPDDKWALRKGGGEVYIQEKSVQKVAPFLTKEALISDASDNLLKALSCCQNLLSQFEVMYAKVFFTETEQTELREKFSLLLFGEGELEARLTDFLSWSKNIVIPGKNIKKGINATACSFFLSMSNPVEYPFCKPVAYNAAVETFLSDNQKKNKPVERLIHCRELYKAVLKFLSENYRLTNGNLLDVHSLMYLISAYKKEPSQSQYWVYAPGSQAKYWDEFYNAGIMGLGCDFLGDLKEYASKEEIKVGIQEHYNSKQSHMNDVLACYEFANKIQVGDHLFVKKGTKEMIGYGVVESDYFWDERRSKYKNVRKVKWLNKGSWGLEDEHFTVKALTNISQYKDFVERLMNLIDSKDEPPEITGGYNLEEELSELFVNDSDFYDLLELLKQKKNIILQGPPGVGKTFIARHIAWALMGAKDTRRLAMVQFHQSYSYEDFIQGYRPDDSGGFYLKNGIFYEFCKRAEEYPNKEYFFIIDEINRGNLSKIFGELMMLIEPDKRGEYRVPLTYSSDEDETFTVPPNVYLIGTMNTADRSLALVDYALRRRFCFHDLKPAFSEEKFNAFLKKQGIDKATIERINWKLKKLNAAISGDTKNLGPGFRIGHSYFCVECEDSDSIDDWFDRIVEFEIAPLLREYWFDNPEEAEKQVELLKE